MLSVMASRPMKDESAAGRSCDATSERCRVCWDRVVVDLLHVMKIRCRRDCACKDLLPKRTWIGSTFAWPDSHVTYRCRFLLLLSSISVIELSPIYVVLAVFEGYTLSLSLLLTHSIYWCNPIHNLCSNSFGGRMCCCLVLKAVAYVPIYVVSWDNLSVVTYTLHGYTCCDVLCRRSKSYPEITLSLCL